MSTSEEIVAYVEDGHVAEVEKSVADLLAAPPVKLTIDGRQVEIKRLATVALSVTLIDLPSLSRYVFCPAMFAPYRAFFASLC